MRILTLKNHPDDRVDIQCHEGEVRMSLRFFEEVEFQTDLTSYGVGRVIAVLPATDEVKVLDEYGLVWRGPIDLVSPTNDDAVRTKNSAKEQFRDCD